MKPGITAVGLVVLFLAAIRVADAAPLSGAISYQGRLLLSGAPVDDTADFQFTLWDADVEGNMVGSTVAVSDVLVADGLFTVSLDFGANAFNGDARWLEIAVRSPHDPGDTEPLTTLSPRQAIAAAPYALQTRGIVHDDSTGNVGIGTAAPTARLHLYNPQQEYGAGTRLVFGDEVPNTGVHNAYIGEFGWQSQTDSDQLQLQAKLGIHLTTNAPNEQTRMFIGSNGNVGIGTTEPSARLHVSRGDGLENISRTIALGGARVGGQFDYAAFDFRNFDNDGGQVDYTGARISSRNNGDSDDGDLRFLTAADQTLTEQMVILPDGNVGIGTTSPAYRLHTVDENEIGAIWATSNLGIANHGAITGETTAPDGTAIWGSANNGDLAWAVVGESATGAAIVGLSSEGAAGYFEGHVGIGTAAPQLPLTVETGPGQYGMMHSDGTRNVVTWLGTSEGTDGAWMGPTSSHALSLQTSNAARLSITADGNVGIGTTTPLALFHVLGGPAFHQVKFDSSDPGGTWLHLINSDTGGTDWSLVSTGSENTEGAGTLLFYDWSGGPRMLLDTAGNIGIGTTAPDVRLEVDGGTDAEPTGGGFIQAGPSNLHNLVIDTNEIMARQNGATSNLFLNKDGGDVVIANAGAGNVGIGRTPTTNRLEVAGDASKDAAGDWLANSDARIKTDVTTIEGANALEKLDRVRLVEFRYSDEYRAGHPSITDRRYVNVIAQEFAEVFPDHVKSSGEKLPAGDHAAGEPAGACDSDRDEILQVDPYPLTIYSAAAVQELHALVKQQAARITALEARLDSLGSADRTSAATAGARSSAITAALAGGAVLLLALGLMARLHRGRRAMTLLLAAGMLTVAATATVARADDFEIDWFTIDGGGITFAAGGDFDLGGTLGQSDAGEAALTGGSFELVGGFWPVATGADGCAQPGDLSLDGDIDGDDVQLFVNCLLGAGGPNCICADMDGGGVGVSDVELFVSLLVGS